MKVAAAIARSHGAEVSSSAFQSMEAKTIADGANAIRIAVLLARIIHEA